MRDGVLTGSGDALLLYIYRLSKTENNFYGIIVSLAELDAD